MAFKQLGTGLFTSGLEHAIVTPRIPKELPPIVYLHGAGGDASEGPFDVDGTINLLTFLADEGGFTTVAPTVTSLWGNETYRSRIDDALLVARADFRATAVAPIFIGFSAGAQGGLTYALNKPTTAVIGGIPLLNLTKARNDNILAQQASINTAHGVTGTNALPALVDPYLHQTELQATPIQLWPATNDVISDGYATFVAGTGAELHEVGALGHTAAAMAAVDPETVLEFILEVIN